jgi:hypothetical protein
MPLKNAEILREYLSLYGIEVKVNEDQRNYTNRFANLCLFGANKYIFLKWIYYPGCLCLSRKYKLATHYCDLVETNITNRSENIQAVKKYCDLLQKQTMLFNN